MVSTRAMARKEPGVADGIENDELALRKKPVRKATAKQTKAPANAMKSTKAAMIAKSRRTLADTSVPLSPKKVIQVAKAPSRSTKASEAKQRSTKAAAKPAPAETAVTRRGRPKKTDENAIESSVITDQSTKTGNRLGNTDMPVVDSEDEEGNNPFAAPASDRSPLRNPPTKRLKSRKLASNRKAEVYQDDSDSESAHVVSGDELCGPKTPMRRSSPETQAKYLTSIQRTQRRESEKDPLQTSTIRFQVLGTSKGTPQTEKPGPAAATIASVARPKTVAKGGRDSFEYTFKNTDVVSSTTASGGSRTPSKRLARLGDVPTTVSKTPKRVFAAPKAATKMASRESTPGLRQAAASYTEVDGDDETILHNDQTMNEQVENYSDDDVDYNDTILIDHSDETIMTVDAVDEIDALAADRDETALEGHDKDDMTLLTDDKAPIHHQPSPAKSATLDVETNALQKIISASPETIVWERIRDNVTIPLDFDKYIMSPVQQRNCRLDAVIGAERRQSDELDSEIEWSGIREESQENVDGLPMDQGFGETAVLNQFIDLAALTEDATDALDVDILSEVEHDAVNDTATKKGKSVPATPIQSPRKVSDDIFASASQPTRSAISAIDAFEADLPHYAYPTAAFDARRKSLPVWEPRTPVGTGTRPNTSDGATMPRMSYPFTAPWWARSTPASKIVTPRKTPSRLLHSPFSKGGTPRSISSKPQLSPTRSIVKLYGTPRHSTALTTKPMMISPKKSALKSPLKQSPAATTRKPDTAVHTPQAAPKERYPKLAPPKTVAAPPRFQTPVSTPIKRPVTIQKPSSLRKQVLQNTTPRQSRTPVKTPLKPPAMTPGNLPMTPHPKAPLRGVFALVEVFTNEGASASAPFIALLHRLGARTTKAWRDGITHVIFKDGSPTTLQRVRLAHKDAEASNWKAVYCLNSRWVTDCEAEGIHVAEDNDVYVVDIDEVPRGGKRRRKSMEPSALVNLGGNVVNSRSSLGRASIGRSSLGRSPLKFDSPAMTVKSSQHDMREIDVGLVDKENSADELSEPATPAWISAPDQLVQQTAPINKVRKLDLSGKVGRGFCKERRQTFWTGSA